MRRLGHVEVSRNSLEFPQVEGRGLGGKHNFTIAEPPRKKRGGNEVLYFRYFPILSTGGKSWVKWKKVAKLGLSEGSSVVKGGIDYGEVVMRWKGKYL